MRFPKRLGDEHIHLRLRDLAALISLAAVSPSALSSPPEVKVFTDEIAEARGQSLEFIGSLNRPPGGSPLSGNVFQGYGEYGYGVARNWELSVYAPVAHFNGDWITEGGGVMLTYISPHDESMGGYWGFNVDPGYLAMPGENRSWSVDFRPILGYRLGDWHFALNPGIEIPVTGAQTRTTFNPRAKAAYSLDENNTVGLEYYGEAGPVTQLLPYGQRNEVAYLVWDGKVDKVDLNVGAGTHLTNASDRWVVKAVLSFAWREPPAVVPLIAPHVPGSAPFLIRF